MLSGIPLTSSQFISPFSGIHLNKQSIPILKSKVNLPLLVLVVNEMVASECKGDGDTGEKAQTNFLSSSHCKQMFSCLQRSFHFISSLNRFVPCWEEITEIGKNFMVSEKTLHNLGEGQTIMCWPAKNVSTTERGGDSCGAGQIQLTKIGKPIKLIKQN